MKSSRDPRWAGLSLVLLVLAGFGPLAGGTAAARPDALAPPAVQSAVAPDAQSAHLSDADIEAFLRTARIVGTRSAGKGVTDSTRATLTDGTLTHDAHVQAIEDRRDVGPSTEGPELNFRDSWTSTSLPTGSIGSSD